MPRVVSTTRPYDSTTFAIERLRLEFSMTLSPRTLAASDAAVGAPPELPFEALAPEEPPEFALLSKSEADEQAALITAAATMSARGNQRDVDISTAFLA